MALKVHAAKVPRGVPASTVSAGYVRATGATSYHRKLALSRAKAVAAVLVKVRIPGKVTATNDRRTTVRTALARKVVVTTTYWVPR
jgi:outer membrane protein OmpA-like peptidoglycan-associated protein